jgi:hypothetical protein
MSFGFLIPDDFYLICLSNLLTLSVPDDGDRRPSFMSYMKSKAAQTILKYEDVNIKNNILLRSLLQITICTKIFQNTLISNLVYPTRFWTHVTHIININICGELNIEIRRSKLYHVLLLMMIFRRFFSPETK